MPTIPGKFLTVDTATGEMVLEEAVNGGTFDETKNRIVRLNDQGKIAAEFIESEEASFEEILAGDTSIGGYSLVNIYTPQGGSEIRCRPAIAADNTKPAQGFVKQGGAAGSSIEVYAGGIHVVEPSFFEVTLTPAAAAAAVGKRLWLSTTATGKATLTVPEALSTSAIIHQCIGHIWGVGPDGEGGTTIRVRFDFSQVYWKLPAVPEV